MSRLLPALILALAPQAVSAQCGGGFGDFAGLHQCAAVPDPARSNSTHATRVRVPSRIR